MPELSVYPALFHNHPPRRLAVKWPNARHQAILRSSTRGRVNVGRTTPQLPVKPRGGPTPAGTLAKPATATRGPRSPKLVTPPTPPPDATAEDVVGAIFCPNVAARLNGTAVSYSFPGHGVWSGEVISFAVMEHLNGAILHRVRFTDAETEDYSFQSILLAHARFLAESSPAAPRKALSLAPDPSLPTPVHPLALLVTQPLSSTALALPTSLQNYPSVCLRWCFCTVPTHEPIRLGYGRTCVPYSTPGPLRFCRPLN